MLGFKSNLASKRGPRTTWLTFEWGNIVSLTHWNTVPRTPVAARHHNPGHPEEKRFHDDVMVQLRILHYWTFVRESYQPPMDSTHQVTHKGSEMDTRWYTMMTSSNGSIFRVTGTLWGESTDHRWIPLTKASDAELWCFLRSAPE